MNKEEQSEILELGSVTEETRGAPVGLPTDDGVHFIKQSGLSND